MFEYMNPALATALIAFFVLVIAAPTIIAARARVRARGVARSMANHPAGKGR